jgi:hypothetical protein
MKPREIKIIEHPDGKLAPEDGAVTTLKHGDTVIFTAEAGASSPQIEFHGHSPFRGKVIYQEPMTVDATHDTGNPAANKFRYDCKFVKNGVARESLGGGVIEIASGSD